MITHECINCSFIELIPIAPTCPVMQRYFCPECGEEQWIYHSRLSPCTYSKDQVIWNKKTKSVKIKENTNDNIG